MCFIFAYIRMLFSLFLWHLCGARAPLPVSLHTAAVSLHCCKNDSGDMRMLSACFQVQLTYFHIHVTFSFRSPPLGLKAHYIRLSIAGLQSFIGRTLQVPGFEIGDQFADVTQGLAVAQLNDIFYVDSAGQQATSGVVTELKGAT